MWLDVYGPTTKSLHLLLNFMFHTFILTFYIRGTLILVRLLLISLTLNLVTDFNYIVVIFLYKQKIFSLTNCLYNPTIDIKVSLYKNIGCN